MMMKRFRWRLRRVIARIEEGEKDGGKQVFDRYQRESVHILLHNLHFFVDNNIQQGRMNY